MDLQTLFRREWGAVTFVLTVLVGMVIVPLALYFGNVRPAPVSLPQSTASEARTSTSSPRISPPASPSPSPTRSP